MANSKVETKMKIIFMGTPQFGATILDRLIQGSFRPVLVVTAQDKPVGRKKIITPPAVKVLAEKYNIPLLQPKKIKDVFSEIKEAEPDIVLVAAYGQLIPKEILEIPKFGCLNVHPSLLPEYRGPSPVQTAILNGDKKSGATIMLINEKMDQGPILAQRELEIEEKETGKTLENKLAGLGADLLMETITKWTRKMIKPQPQEEGKATYTKILTRENGRINWQKTAQDTERQVRAFDPWPGAFTFWQKRGKSVKIKILRARVFKSPESIRYPVGKVLVVPQNEIGIQCGKGFLAGRSAEGEDFLAVGRVQMEGKKEMEAEEFLRGCAGFVGSILN